MAIKPTIYKLTVSLSDLNRNIYDSFGLTIARHPSETIERMAIRMLVYCLNKREKLVFSRGLSNTEEPDMWAHSLNDELELWIDVGEPSPDRVKKVSRMSKEVKIYSFNSKAPTWWQQHEKELTSLDADFYRFKWDQVEALASIIDRGVDLSVTISADSLFVASELGECELILQRLQRSS